MTPGHTRPGSSAGFGLSSVLGLLTVFGPIAMDLYLPVLPDLASDLGASTSLAQLTVTACLIGLALGQVIAGPLSDRYGRRTPMLIGVIAFVITSVACAVAPTIETLILLRVVQGAAGSAGIVIAQAAGRDIYTGGKLIRYYGRMTVIAGLAAIVGPVIGGGLATFVDWRGVFLFLAIIGGLILLAGFTLFRETLAPAARSSGGISHTLRAFRTLLSDRLFLGMLLIGGFTNAGLFAYLSGATFLLQDGYGLSPQEYALAFGLNSAGFMVCGFLAGRAGERWSERSVLACGVLLGAVGAGGLITTGLLDLPVIGVIVSLLILVSGVAVTTPPSTALALRRYPQTAGTAASLLGVARYLFGGLAAPLVGLGASNTALPLGIITATSAVGAIAVFLTLTRPAITGARPIEARPIEEEDTHV